MMDSLRCQIHRCLDWTANRNHPASFGRKLDSSSPRWRHPPPTRRPSHCDLAWWMLLRPQLSIARLQKRRSQTEAPVSCSCLLLRRALRQSASSTGGASAGSGGLSRSADPVGRGRTPPDRRRARIRWRQTESQTECSSRGAESDCGFRGGMTLRLGRGGAGAVRRGWRGALATPADARWGTEAARNGPRSTPGDAEPAWRQKTKAQLRDFPLLARRFVFCRLTPWQPRCLCSCLPHLLSFSSALAPWRPIAQRRSQRLPWVPLKHGVKRLLKRAESCCLMRTLR